VHFAFTEDQLTITEAAREMLVDSCTPADLRNLLVSQQATCDARWATITEMGLIGMLAPEDRGGLGLQLIDFVGIAEAAGYVALPEPLLIQAGIVVPLLAGLADDKGWLERVMAGEIVAVGHPGNPFVADADAATALLLSEGDRLHLVPRDRVTLTRHESFDPFRRLFSAEWTPSPDTALAAGWGDVFARGALLAAAEMVGVGQRAIDMAVAYAKDRTQFGKPIGSYQAVKHLVADAQVKIEFARPVVQAAAAELPLGSPEALARLAHAKIAASEAADLATRNAVQVHGAMGMTWEVDLHFWVKRAIALRGTWGTISSHGRTVAQRMLNRPIGPETTFASAAEQPAAAR
jgi:alkylation response protein AidB-like acyl-CoA dehydrogenase